MKLFRYHNAIDTQYNDIAYFCEKIDMDGYSLLDFRASFESYHWNELDFDSESDIKDFIKKHYGKKVYIFRDAVFSIDKDDINYFCDIQWE